MNLLKRPELLALFVLAAGAAVWVLSTRSSSDYQDEQTETVAADAESGEPPLKIHRCILERDFGNARLDIELRYANRSEEKLVMRPPQVRLVTAKGGEVPPFFLPFDPRPEILAKTTGDARLRYWLEKSHLDGSLTLHIRDQSIAIKSAAPLDLDKLKNREPVTFSGADWKP